MHTSELQKVIEKKSKRNVKNTNKSGHMWWTFNQKKKLNSFVNHNHIFKTQPSAPTQKVCQNRRKSLSESFKPGWAACGSKINKRTFAQRALSISQKTPARGIPPFKISNATGNGATTNVKVEIQNKNKKPTYKIQKIPHTCRNLNKK